MTTEPRPLAIVTEAASGLGFQLAQRCAQGGFDLLITAGRPPVMTAAEKLRAFGASVEAFEGDLATLALVDELSDALADRPVAALLVNMGPGLGGAFLDQKFEHARHLVDVNVTGILYLIHTVGRRMRQQRNGRILIAGASPSLSSKEYQAVYNGTKALLDSFSFTLRAELAGSGVSVTSLMPGVAEVEPSPHDDERAAEKVGWRGPVDEELAEVAFDALLRGKHEVAVGWQNELRAAVMSMTNRPGAHSASAALSTQSSAQHPSEAE